LKIKVFLCRENLIHMKKIATIIGLLLVPAMPYAQTTLTLPLTDIAYAELCSGQSVTITASAASKGNALDLNGTTGSALVPNTASVSLAGLSNFTVSCWIYPRSNNLQSILYHGLGCSTWGSWGLGIGGAESADAAWSKKIAFYFRTSNASASKSVVASDTVVLNQWVHVAVSYDGTNLRLYINGVLDKTTAATGTPWTSTEKLSMGSDPGCSGRNFYDGKLDEVQFWGKTRSATEISGSYDKIALPSSPNLNAYWRFDENNGEYIYDVSPDKNTGTINTAVSREIPSTAPLPVMSSGTTTFAWRPATGLSATTGATVTAAPATTTDYTVTAKNTATGDTNTNLVRIKVNPVAAKPMVATPVRYCKGATAAALTATKGSATDTLYWYTTASGGTGSKIAPLPSTATTGMTKYYVSAKTNLGCESARDSINVIVSPAPDKPTVITPLTYCEGAATTPLTATAGSTSDTLYWYTAATSGTGSKTAITPPTATAGTRSYFVSAKSAAGCESDRDSIQVTIKPAAAPTVSTPVKYCQNATPVALTATAAGASDTLYWYTTATGGTGSRTAPTPAATTVGTTPYYVSSKLTNGCESARKLINVQINPPAITPVAPSPVKYCKGATAAALTATKGSTTDTLFWYTVPVSGTGSKTAPTPVTTATGTTFYYVDATTAEGCKGSQRDTVEVIVDPVPAVPTVSTPVIYCQDSTAVALTATAASTADTLYWYTAATGGTGSKTTPTPSTSSAGTSSQYVAGRNTFGCESSRAKIDITINPRGATPTVTTPVHYCKGEPTVALTATKGSSSDTLLWYTASTGGTDSRAAPTPSSATAGTTPYYVSAKTNLGCEGDRTTINVQINPIADTPGVTTPVVYCQKDKPFALIAAKGAFSDTLLWYTVPSGGTAGKTAPIPSTATAGRTFYYVSGKTSFGCESGRDTIEVIVNPEPVVTVSSLSPTGIIHCRNVDSVLLKATAPTAVAYQWYYEKAIVPGSVYDTVYARKTGYWAAVVTDAKGCRNNDSIWIQRDTLEEPILTPSESKMCIGASTLLTCHPGYATNRFKWFRNNVFLTGIPLTVNTATAPDTGTYYVEMTNAVGCTYTTNKARVDFYPLMPKPSLVYTPPVLSIAGGTYRAFQWYRDVKTIFSATGSTYTVGGKGKYYVEVTDANGCTRNSDTLDIQLPGGIKPQYVDMNIRLYPNPTHTSVTIDAPVKVNVTVTDMAGKSLMTIPDASTIDLADFADGSYFFRITDEHGQTLGTEKINKISAP
jgi:hypothetical protein